MKNIFIAMAATLILSTGQTLSEQIPEQPKIPKGAEFKEEKDKEKPYPCGTLKRYSYMELGGGKMVLWAKLYLGSREHPLILAKVTARFGEYWVDKNRDGRFEEYYVTHETFMARYPTPCNIAPK